MRRRLYKVVVIVVKDRRTVAKVSYRPSKNSTITTYYCDGEDQAKAQRYNEVG
jgi:hypothetical protein